MYRARDLHFPTVVKLVAVKEMLNQARDPLVRKTIVQNFEREANILVTLDHPAIPKIFDFFNHEEKSYLVLEIVNGTDLEQIIRDVNEPISEDQVIAWAIEICDVLHYLHTLKPSPIIFRDVKPSNIMVTMSGHIVMVDFGIAKIFTEGQKGTMVGTEGYSPPEQYRGEASPQADIYSLGATMHHLLTLRDPRLEPPFSFSERPVRSFNPSVSIDLEAVINTALQYNPADRFSSASEMKEALLQTARRTGALGRITSDSQEKRNETVKPVWVFDCEDEVRGAPAFDNGIIYVGSCDNNLYALDSASGEFIWKVPTSGGIVSKPVIHENMVFFGSEDGKLYVVSARNGKNAWEFATSGPIRCAPVVFDGSAIVGSDDGFIYAVYLATTTMSWRTDSGNPIRSTPAIANDTIVFGNEGGELICLDNRGSSRWRFKAKRAITSSPLVYDGRIYFTSLDSYIYAIDAKSGWVVWRFRMEKGSVSSPCAFESMVYAGSVDGNLYCLEAENAREVWRFKMGHQVSGSPVVSNGRVYCGAADNVMYCLEAATGKLIWKFSVGAPITSAATLQNGIIYFGSLDHRVYAIKA